MVIMVFVARHVDGADARFVSDDITDELTVRIGTFGVCVSIPYSWTGSVSRRWVGGYIVKLRYMRRQRIEEACVVSVNSRGLVGPGLHLSA